MKNIDWKYIFENSNFWAIKVAKEGIRRAKRKNKNIITVRCANTPTGVLHIGNANDPIRAYFIAKSIEVLGYKSRVVFTSDDRDPIRGFPPIICDKEGNLVEFNKKEEYEKKYDGFPVFAIPDPFKCHSSWSEHFLSVYFNELRLLGIIDSIQFEYYSPNVLYHSGEWEKYVKIVLDDKDKVNEIFKEFKEKIREYPFSPICQNCGRIGTTHVIEYNPETGEVIYVCEKRHLKKKTVEGCGYEGKTTIRFGKVDWYIEWAIDWVYFDTDIEPMGKDHWVSSFRISPRFTRELFGFEEPIPVPYEFFTVNGKKMSGSKGNIWNITEMLKILEPEVFLYLYTKRPMTERDINLKNINLLVDEFDKLEEKVYRTLHKLDIGEISIDNLKDHKYISNYNLATFEELTIYYLVTGGRIHEKPIRIPYNFAAVIGQIINKDLLRKTNVSIVDLGNIDRFGKDIETIKEILKRSGYIKDDIDIYRLVKVVDRIRKAGYWAINYGPDYLKIKLNEKKIDLELSQEEKDIIRKIVEFLNSIEYSDLNIIQTEIHKIIVNHSRNIKEIYKKLYRILLNKDKGPKIGTLIVVFGKDKISGILSQYLK